MVKKSMWTLVPVGSAMLMITEEVPLAGEVDQLNEVVQKLTELTGIPWFFIGSTKMVDEEAVKEIAERYYGIKK